MARTGKIARLPPSIFEEFNERLLANPVGNEILDWVNALPEVKERLEKLFKGEPISAANLSVWREEGGGFDEWKRDRAKLAFIESIASTTVKLAEKAGNRFARNTIPVAVGAIYSALEEGQSVEFTEAGKPFVTGIGADKLGKAVAALATSEQNDERLAQNREKLDLEKEKLIVEKERLSLDTKKFNHVRVKSFIDWSKDEEAKKIATSDMPNDEKMEALGKHLFGEAW